MSLGLNNNAQILTLCSNTGQRDKIDPFNGVITPEDMALRNRIEMFGAEAGAYIFRLESKLSAAETRIEVLEAALRKAREALEWCDMFLKCGLHPGRIENEGCPTCVLIDVIRKRRAALAAPSGEAREKV